ncbi:hypothetical protein ACNI3Q_10215 [Sphingomonas sp. FW199]|uniref:hypothetical protein n=1 Tax=Sphingomonas sp. FW199 TaxID=3400217 RepID=UPI003CE69A6D
MTRAALAALFLLTLAGCGADPAAPPPAEPAHPLEQAAIERGLVPDPASASPIGLYARDSDRLCLAALPGGEQAGKQADPARFRIGALVDYGEGLRCAGRGEASLSGDRLTVQLGEGACRFDAAFDGDRIAFPAELPDACLALCQDERASFSAMQAERLSDRAAEAEAFRLPDGVRPCAD